MTSELDGPTDSPADLVARIRDGDEFAFESVFRTTAPKLIHFAIKFGVTSPTAEDVVTNVFVSLWDGRARLDISKNLDSYLYRAVRNGVLDTLRSARRETVRYERASVAGDVPGMGEMASSIDAVTEAEAAADIVWAAAALLPESQRTALILRYTNELSLAEVAESMELTIPAIKSLLQRAHRTLRERLGGVFQDL